jgi:hypothetical protein
VESAAAVDATWSESARALRELAQQCYLLIGLADDARLKSHLLDLGLGLERRISVIEGGSPVTGRRA